jgi:cytochrome c oxidase assembly factor CtaG
VIVKGGHLGEFLVPAVAALAYAAPYWLRTRTLARQRRPVPTWRLWCFAAGIGVVLLAVSPPFDRLADRRLVAHMAQHLLLMDAAALLVVAGLTGPVLAPLLRFRTGAILRPLTNPVVALSLWAIDLFAWHIPFFYDAALRNDFVHDLEHAMFFWAGLNAWLALLGPLPAPRWFGNWAKLGYLVAMRLIGAILANVLVWSQTPFYSYYTDRLSHSHALSDQNTAGGVMMVEGSILTIMLLCWMFLRFARRDEDRQRLVELAAAHGVALSDERAARAVAAGHEELLRERIETGQAID